MDTFEITPTPRGYAQLLTVLMKDGRKVDKVWAKLEMERIQPALMRGYWEKG